MHDSRKTKEELIAELQELRHRVALMEKAPESHRDQSPFRVVADTAASAIFIFKDSMFRYANPATSKLSGYLQDELLGLNTWSLLHPEHLDLIKERLEAWFRGEPVPQRSEFKILTRSGETRWIDADSTFIDFEGEAAVLTIAYDITDRKRAEEALGKTQARLQHVLSFSPAIIYLLQVNHGKLTAEWVSDSLVRLTGHELTEALAEGWWMDNIHPDDRDRVLAGMLTLFQHDHLVLEYRFRHNDGGYMWLRDETRLLRDGAGNPIEAIGSWVDVTERRGAEAALRDSEERFRTLVSSMDDMVFTVDLQERYTGAFGRWIEKFGLERKDLIGRTASEIFGADAAPIHEDAYPQALAGEQVVYDWSMIAGGERRHFQTSLSPIRDQSGKVSGLVGVGRDSTASKIAEEALLASEERYRELVENARDIIYSHDLEGNYTSVNKAGEQITGYNHDEIVGMNLAQTVAPEYLQRAREMIASKLAGQKETVYDLEIIAKDGRRVTVEVNTRLVFQNDLPVGIQGIARDVTERKRAEEALRDSQERFRRYFELGLIGMAITSPERGFIEVNDKLCEILGYERAELFALTWVELTHPEDLAADLARFERVLAAQLNGYSMDKRFIKKDGKVIHATISVNCVRRADRSVDYFVSLLQDVSERKNAEQALRKSQSHMQAILDNCPALIFQKDLDGRYLQVNRQFERFSLSPGQVIGRTDYELFAPEIAAGFVATDRKVIDAGRGVEFEETAVSENGLHAYLVHKFPLLDAAGNIYAVGGISTDITARKRAEDDLRKQKEILQKIFDHIPVMIRFLDENGRIKLVNREWERTLGWSLEEIEGRDLDIFAELYPDPEYRQTVLSFIAASTGEFTELRTKIRNGEVIDTAFANVRLEDGTNIGIGRDITDSKRAADLLSRQTAQLAALHEIDLEISAESDLSRILEVVTIRAAELLAASDCSTYIRDRDDATLTTVASLNSKFVGLRLEEGEGLAGRAFGSGEVQMVDDYGRWPGRTQIFDCGSLGPAIAAPLKWQQTVIGAIALSRKRGKEPFTDEDSTFLEGFAAEAAIAIHQTTLFEEIQEGQRRLQVLSHRLIDAQEAERKRLARELHDQIGQALTAVQISLQTLQAGTRDTSAKVLEDSLVIIDEAIQQVHDLSLDLRPSLLDDLGLVAALRWYVGRVASRAGLAHRFKADVATRLAPEVETACFRIAQEALTNVLRHAGATNVSVEVTYANSDLRLLVRDNGVGFDVRAAMRRTGLNASLGLQGMQERAAAIGGSVDIKSNPRRGTKVQATLSKRAPVS